MQSIKLQTHIGDDGLLEIKLPVGMTNQDLEIIVIYQPINQTRKELGRLDFLNGLLALGKANL